MSVENLSESKKLALDLQSCGLFEGLPDHVQTGLMERIAHHLDKGENIEGALANAYNLYQPVSEDDDIATFGNSTFGLLKIEDYQETERDDGYGDGLMTCVVSYKCNGERYKVAYNPECGESGNRPVEIINKHLVATGTGFKLHQMDYEWEAPCILARAEAIITAMDRGLIPEELFDKV